MREKLKESFVTVSIVSMNIQPELTCISSRAGTQFTLRFGDAMTEWVPITWGQLQ